VPFPVTIATTLDMNYFLLYIRIPQQGPDHMPQGPDHMPQMHCSLWAYRGAKGETVGKYDGL
jgi:hypothetical protein